MKPNVEGQNVYEDIEFLQRMDSGHRPIIISPDQERRFLKNGYLTKVEGRFELTSKARALLAWTPQEP